jgi:signal transduction histidine kinase
MERMIDNLLLVARGGDSELDIEPVDLPDLLNTSWRAIRAPNAQLEIETECQVYADKDGLHKLIENLCRNAIEHAGSDVTIRVGDLRNGFYVEDNGEGIPEGEREAVFTKGYSTGEVGTGLGLTVAENISDAHGWEITIVERTSGGARFEITGVERVTPNDQDQQIGFK